ncbi:MAG: OsmC family protein [Firmicutes bacterium]|nr:OsmC family protein [Bacillota bacterium]
MSNAKFSVKSKSENPTKTVVEARSFKMIIDEPAPLGGTDHGPNPVEYVLAALSGCLNVVGHMIANEMGFALRGLEFNVEGDLNTEKFQGLPTSGRAGFMEIRVTVIPDTDADSGLLQKWLEKVIERCPVSDNLANATPVKIMLGA